MADSLDLEAARVMRFRIDRHFMMFVNNTAGMVIVLISFEKTWFGVRLVLGKYVLLNVIVYLL